MGIEGNLTIDLTINKNTKNDVSIQSTRPVHACRVFHGKQVSEALMTLPLLFNICGFAQACAGVRACEQALSMKVSLSTEQVRDALVNMETLREHLWRLLLEWPLFSHDLIDKTGMSEMVMIQRDYQKAMCSESNIFILGSSEIQPDQTQLRSVVKRFTDLLQYSVFSISPAKWLTLVNQQELAKWSASEKTIAAKLINQILMAHWSDSGACQSVSLPELDLPQLFLAMQDGNFVKQPQWLGQCCETSSLTRVESPLIKALTKDFGNGLLVRLVARLTEIAQLAEQLNGEKVIKKNKTIEFHIPNQGVGQVAAARGHLLHRVIINKDLIEHYQILAPTEWNFHPQGVVAQALSSLEGDTETIEQKARLLINSIDPCVAYKLQITG